MINSTSIEVMHTRDARRGALSQYPSDSNMSVFVEHFLSRVGRIRLSDRSIGREGQKDIIWMVLLVKVVVHWTKWWRQTFPCLCRTPAIACRTDPATGLLCYPRTGNSLYLTGILANGGLEWKSWNQTLSCLQVPLVKEDILSKALTTQTIFCLIVVVNY